MKTTTVINVLTTCILFFFCLSCDEKDMYEGYWVDDLNDISKAYIYPYENDSENVVAEITVETDGTVDLNSVVAEIPYLKYNKQLLVMLTQDDCKQSAFCRTWAAIHNRPIPQRYYYDYVHLKAGDLPSDMKTYDKTLGITDGAGNEVRFSFTTTIAPEWDFMDAKSEVAIRPLNNSNRFIMKSGLTWRNLIEMLNYDVGIAFHDVKTNLVENVDSIYKHYVISQNIVLNKLSGRGCKVLAEPNGNKTYIEAAKGYDPIQSITAQAGAEKIYPFAIDQDLHKVIQERWFIEGDEIKSEIQKQMSLSVENRSAVHIGVHNTDYTWTDLLLWLNDIYGKDGDDIVWMPSFEEYYEYNYNRINGSVDIMVDGKSLKIKVIVPGGQYFYFPSTTVNLLGINMNNVVSITSNNSVAGLSYADSPSQIETNKYNLMINLDCRSSLIEHAEHYVKEYEENKSDELLRSDAIYFINRLKKSEKKDELLQKVK